MFTASCRSQAEITLITVVQITRAGSLLSVAANYALAESDIIARLAATGIDAVSDSTPGSTASFLAAEYGKFRDIVCKADLRITQ
jgi:hypothetical protein